MTMTSKQKLGTFHFAKSGLPNYTVHNMYPTVQYSKKYPHMKPLHEHTHTHNCEHGNLSCIQSKRKKERKKIYNGAYIVYLPENTTIKTKYSELNILTSHTHCIQYSLIWRFPYINWTTLHYRACIHYVQCLFYFYIFLFMSMSMSMSILSLFFRPFLNG